MTTVLLGLAVLWFAIRPAPPPSAPDRAYVIALEARVEALEHELAALQVDRAERTVRAPNPPACEHQLEAPLTPEASAPVSRPVVHEVDEDAPAELPILDERVAPLAPARRAEVEAEAKPEEDPWAPPRRDAPVFDIDGSGEVTPDERERADELAVRASEFAANRSSDGTYPILAEDFRGSPRLFAAMDDNEDGALSTLEAMRYFVASIRELRRYDQDHDGALALAEYGHLESRFGFLDTNGDQRIEAWEINLLRARGKW